MSGETGQLDGLGFEFGDPPESVQKNVLAMQSIIEQRRRGNENTAAKHDTERYLVLVFSDRGARETLLKALNLPHDERYLYADALDIRVAEGKMAADAVVLAERSCKAAEVSKSGAGG